MTTISSGTFFLGSINPYRNMHKGIHSSGIWKTSAIHFNIANSQQRIRELLEEAQETTT